MRNDVEVRSAGRTAEFHEAGLDGCLKRQGSNSGLSLRTGGLAVTHAPSVEYLRARKKQFLISEDGPSGGTASSDAAASLDRYALLPMVLAAKSR